MKMLSYILIGIILVFTILVITGRKSAHSEIEINATPETVWKTLITMEEYDQWNPVMELTEGTVKEGNQVKYQFTQDENNTSEIGATVVRIKPQELLNQKGGIPLILTFDHSYTLRPSGNGTRVIIHEDYRGVGVNFWNPEAVEKAYIRLNSALKERAESK